jgi:membrane protease YdiL (CAAX protease family)
LTIFQQIALIITVVWLVLVVVRFRRSGIVLVSGILVLGLYTLLAVIFHQATTDELGLGRPDSWWLTIGLAIAGLAVLLAYSPLADRLASRWFKKPPTLDAFKAIQQSRIKLIAGIVTAWILGGFLEELIARGIVLNSVATLLNRWVSGPVSNGIAVCIAGLGAGLMHFYQGPRAVSIITQLSILFGVLFVVCGHNLWTVIFCHGLYDTIAFIRFANKKSRYSNPG